MPPRNHRNQAPTLSADLENYAQLYFKYSLIFENQVNVVRHKTKEVDEAYAKVCGEHNGLQRDAPPTQTGLEELYNVLKYFGDLCEANSAPQTVIELS
jgi:hypothetical protein